MPPFKPRRRPACLVGFLGLVCLAGALDSRSASLPVPPYRAISPVLAGTTVVLTGNDLTVEQLAQIARHGAKVQLRADARQRQGDDYGLLLEAQAEGVPVYGLNRGGGLARSTVILEGDPLSAGNREILQQRELAAFEDGALAGDGPEIADEALVRATMAIRANEMVHEMPSPQLSQMLLDLLNKGVTPVMQSRGTVGESDWNLLPNIGGTLVGRGEAYLHGVRMPAAQALRRAGLAPLKPFALDSSTLFNSNGYTTALAAFLVLDGRHALDWADLADAMDLEGMNSSITPLSAPVQRVRPNHWLNWDAARVLGMVKGGYLLDTDPARILADPDSLRASAIRQGAAWQAWAVLRDDVQMQMNSSDHNPSVMRDLSPGDSWELATPQMLQYYVKGGKYSNGRHGFIVTSANWDPFPMVNDIEAFTTAMVNVGVVVTQRIYRFDNPFFTGVQPADVVAGGARDHAPQANATLVGHLWQELQLLSNPVPAEGLATDFQGNGDIQSQAALKANRALEAADLLMHLLGQDVLTGAYWLDVRRIQKPARRFGAATGAASTALRKVVPWDGGSQKPAAMQAYDFVKNNSVAQFYPAAADEPGK